jgi:hypothetical protein
MRMVIFVRFTVSGLGLENILGLSYGNNFICFYKSILLFGTLMGL